VKFQPTDRYFPQNIPDLPPEARVRRRRPGRRLRRKKQVFSFFPDISFALTVLLLYSISQVQGPKFFELLNKQFLLFIKLLLLSTQEIRS
jgi:hypothetical protein